MNFFEVFTVVKNLEVESKKKNGSFLEFSKVANNFGTCNFKTLLGHERITRTIDYHVFNFFEYFHSVGCQEKF